MIKLVVIADDLTGSLDTCVQFAKLGAPVKVVAEGRLEGNLLAGGTDVLVVDAETRHLEPSEAYRSIHSLVSRTVEAGVEHIYIKTDSGLRGNIGSSLQAALDASGELLLPFLPAYPEMGRITRGGIQYIDGVPIHRSVFGRDPFDPVRSPHVRDLFAGQGAEVAVFPRSDPYGTRADRPTIGIFDGESPEDLDRIADHLEEMGQLRVCAGCAGFASLLARHIRLPERAAPDCSARGSLAVFCGSLNPITRRQIEYGERVGYRRTVLEPGQLLEEGYFHSPAGERWLDGLGELLAGPCPVTVDTGVSRPEAMEGYLEEKGIPKDRAREQVANALGTAVARLLEKGSLRGRVPMIIGGDTMRGFMERVSWQSLTPVFEPEPGVVLSRVQTPAGEWPVISKSGGFGGEDLLERIRRKLEQQRMEESAL